MLPTINGKEIIDCSYEDLRELIGNLEYRENNYLDYKSSFSILNYKDKKDRDKAIVEFRNDVCSFANSEGGYLIYGIEEDGEGIAKNIVGIEIPNKDKFELSIKDYLKKVSPRIPEYRINTVSVNEGKYILIVRVYHDFYAPYMHIENERNILAYKRIGNSKVVIPYLELRTMFMQSMVLDKEIDSFRKERITYFKENEDQFIVFHIIPDTFLESERNKNVYVLNRNKYPFSQLFGVLHEYSVGIPMVGGMRAFNEEAQEVRLYDNFVAEFFSPIEKYQTKIKDEPFLAWLKLWNDICLFYSSYFENASKFLSCERIFFCISIVGCKNLMTDLGDAFEQHSSIDRDLCMMEPVVFENTDDKEKIVKEEKLFRLEYILSLGIRKTEGMEALIKEVYGNDYN